MPIPKLIFRTVPVHTSAEVEEWWASTKALHPDFEHITYREPVDPAAFPITSPYWERCESGAQKAGLIRLEGLWLHGGIYLDSDVQVYRSLVPLLQLRGFAVYEDADVVPDAVLGAECRHPAIDACVKLALKRIDENSGDFRTDGAWGTGPGVTNTVLRERDDWLLLPPGTFYPYHYTEKKKRRHEDFSQTPWIFAAHHWHHSWSSKSSFSGKVAKWAAAFAHRVRSMISGR
ncbi:MAG: glycosyltransferase [Myxococcota bacterium]|nr:glycosyltransferase [Myxococcota bacterium]